MNSCPKSNDFKKGCIPTKKVPVPAYFETVVVPASVGKADPETGDYTNSLVKYEADGRIFLFDGRGIYTELVQKGAEGDSLTIDSILPGENITVERDYENNTVTISATGGGSVVLYTTTGANEDGAMTQKATTNLIYPDGKENARDRVAIGRIANADTVGQNTIQIRGTSSDAAPITSVGAVSITSSTTDTAGNYAVGIGDRTTAGEFATAIGSNVVAENNNTAIGSAVSAYGNYSTAIGYGTRTGDSAATGKNYAVALGSYSKSSRDSEVSVGSGTNDANHGKRYVANVKDPEWASDAATKGYTDTADATIQGEVDDINSKIPNQATSSNQLADKDFVNSSVATNTANYISNNGQPFTSLAELEAYSGTLTNNDYAFVVGTDSAGNTTYTRYKYVASTGQWSEEYVLNNSSFTAVQWAAINSGITSGNVAKLSTLADIRSIGANLSLDSQTGELSATDTTYSDFTGTDGTTAGASGLVPAPATTDADKFLKSDGTWDTAGGAGDFVALTSDDYSVYGDGTKIQMWKLPVGFYKIVQGTKFQVGLTSPHYGTKTARDGDWVIVSYGSNANTKALIGSMDETHEVSVANLDGSGYNAFDDGGALLSASKVINNLTTSYQPSIPNVLDARQGKVLNDKILGASGAVAAWTSIGTGSSYTKRALQVTLNISETGLTIPADTWTSIGITMPTNYIPTTTMLGSVTANNNGTFEAGLIRVNTDGTVEVHTSNATTDIYGSIVFPVAA